MPKLSDLLSEQSRASYVNGQLTPGTVLCLYCEWFAPHKAKFLVVLCLDPRCMMFRINSRKRPYVQNRPEYLACQVPLLKADYAFLDHDSYLDCSQYVDQMTRDDIVRQLVADPSRIKGTLTAQTTASVVGVVTQSKLFSDVDKRVILQALGS